MQIPICRGYRQDHCSELMKDEKVTWFSVRSINFESIHNHNAYALIERDKRR